MLILFFEQRNKTPFSSATRSSTASDYIVGECKMKSSRKTRRKLPFTCSGDET